MADAQTVTTSVIDYIVQRLADEGITDCFGVPGDYAFPVCDGVERNPKVKWIGCSNELNASYAADGYARVRGAAMLSTTYAVGEMSALNGVMGAKAERSLVYHVVGMPSYQNQRLRKTMHHTLGDGVFGNFINISAQAACCHAVINPDNCIIEMERVIAEARRNNQPAYIVVPSDYALAPITPGDVRPVTICFRCGGFPPRFPGLARGHGSRLVGAAIIAVLFAPIPVRTAIWTLALAWMGLACVLNARRCSRTHCRFTGPYYLAMIIPVVVVGMGIIPLGPYSWTLLGLLILGLIIADAVVIAAPPIRAPRNEGLSA